MSEYGEGHRGIDLATLVGDEVLSPADGEISFSGKVGYREVISVKFGNSLTASMEPVCSELVEGTQVFRGDVIGLVCQPDPEYVWHCEMTCLHFGTRSEAGYFSPLALIGGLSPSRLVYQARG
jgi:murein DD-endopeptidase MepM/ murein hydrolase activator NlpD